MPASDALYLRVIDASANRACEALRVIEDFVRFVHDDAFLSENFKNLRHRLVQNVLKFPMPERLANRETQADVGTQISTRTEFLRSSLQDVLDANFSRLQESLRSLEEFSKLTQPETAHEFEQMRYASYTLQRVVFFTLADDSPRRQALRKVQNAERVPSSAEVRLTGSDGLTLRLATDLTVASAEDRDGFLLETPSDARTVKSARAALGVEKLIGVQVSDEASARQALLTGIDFLLVPTPTLSVPSSPLLLLLRRLTNVPTLPLI